MVEVVPNNNVFQVPAEQSFDRGCVVNEIPNG